MFLHKIVVRGLATVLNPPRTVFSILKAVRFPVAADTGGANICLLNKYV